MHERIKRLLNRIHTIEARSRDKSRFFKESRRLRYEPLEDRRMLATLIVNSLDDDITIDNGDLLLREAIDYVNGRIPGSLDTESDGVVHIDESENLLGYNDIILFDPSLVALGATITLDNNLGHLQLEQTVTIDATALPNGITIDADGGSRVFYINNPGPDENDIYNITLAGLTITGGDTTEDGGGILFQASYSDYSFSILESVVKENHAHDDWGSGGGIYVKASESNYILEFNMVNSIVQENTANFGGGVCVYYPDVDVEGSVTIEGCTFLGNTASGNDTNEFGSSGGGGLFARQEKGELTISESTFQGNISGGSGTKYGGGGIHVELGNIDHATLKLENSTVSGNIATASNGGGVWVNAKYGTFECTQNTISDNSAFDVDDVFSEGGGLWLSHSDSTKPFIANIDHTTITSNHAPTGGGLYSKNSQYVTTTLSHTIVSGNDDGDEEPKPNNIAGAINTDSSYNLIGWGPGTHDNPSPTGTANAGFPQGAGNINSNTPGLRALGYYGGPTQTHMPYSNSAVIDVGDQSTVAELPDYDQRGRGYKRVIGELIDIGAVEYGIGDPDDAPTIVDVIISGSQSVHDDYSFSEAFDKDIHEFTTVPVGGADTIEIVFSEWVDVVDSDLYLQGLVSYTVYTNNENWDIDYVFNETNFIARWRFDNNDDGHPDPFPTDILGIALNYTAGKEIKDADDNELDGDWIWPTSLEEPEEWWQFPSGDGSAGGAFLFTFVILPGDCDQDNDVDGNDFLVWMQYYGQNGTFINGDFDGDGDVDGNDLNFWQTNFGLDYTSVP